MGIFTLNYLKKAYRLHFEHSPFPGVYSVGRTYLIRKNLHARHIPLDELREEDACVYVHTKFNRASMLTLVTTEECLQFFITDAISVSDFHELCRKLYKVISIRQLIIAYYHARLESIVENGLQFANPLVLPILLWMN